MAGKIATPMDRRKETGLVKAALLEAGIPVTRVKHGTGTAWGWLKIYLDDDYAWRNGNAQASIQIAQEVTGRQGEFSGKINIL